MGWLPSWLSRKKDQEVQPYTVDSPLLNTDPPSADAEDIVVLDNLHKTYLLGIEGVPALRGVNLKVKRGEFVTILGTSGGGKTSLLNIIGTIDKPTKGDLTICGQQITWKTGDKTLADVRLNRLGFVFQTFNLISSMSARENVELPMILSGKRDVFSRRKRSKELLTHVGLGGRMKHSPSMMSGGEQQRTTIARALANDPDILLLDEPTGDLDTKNTEIVMRMITELNANEGKTIIMVTHDVALKGFSHRTIHMRDGKIQREEIIPAEKRREKHVELYVALQKQNLRTGVQPSHPAEFRMTEIRHRSEYARFGVRAATREQDGTSGTVPTGEAEEQQAERSYSREEIEEIIRAGYQQVYSANVDHMQGGLGALLEGIQHIVGQEETKDQHIQEEKNTVGSSPNKNAQVQLLSQKLHSVVSDGKVTTVAWDGSGTLVVFHDMDAFVRETLPGALGVNDALEFFRRLEQLGFTRQTTKGYGIAYVHPSFLRDRPDILPLDGERNVPGGMPQVGAPLAAFPTRDAGVELFPNTELKMPQHTKLQ